MVIPTNKNQWRWIVVRGTEDGYRKRGWAASEANANAMARAWCEEDAKPKPEQKAYSYKLEV